MYEGFQCDVEEIKSAVAVINGAIENQGHRQHVYGLKSEFIPSDFTRFNCNYIIEDLRSVYINLH